MPDKITTLKLVDNTDVFPNIKDENIPNTIMRIADLSKYLNQLKAINITGDIDSTTITSDIATFTTADISTLNVSGVSHFEGEATFGNNIHVDGNVIVNGIDNIVDKDGNKIVRNETLDEFTKAFYDNCDVALYMNCDLRTHSNIFDYDNNDSIRIPYLDKVTNLSSLLENATAISILFGDTQYINFPDIPNPVKSANILDKARCKYVNFRNITLVDPIFAFSYLIETNSINVVDGKSANITGEAQYTFAHSEYLVTIGKFDVSRVETWFNAFLGCTNLKSIHCAHFRVSFDISSSTKFEQSDLVEIISNLDSISTAQTLTMGSTNLAKLTQDQILVATGKGWTLA